MADAKRGKTILFAYDGSDEAKEAIRQAGHQLRKGRRAIVLTVWQRFVGVPFMGPAAIAGAGFPERHERDAQQLAREGAALAREEGFDAEGIAEEGDPIWERIVETAETYDADIIVMGSHGRTGLSLVLVGSVAAATARHTERPVLIAHDDNDDTDAGQAA
jgi:nucleotide-binding universal stress UspA family protein